ncbi:MAG: chemotaxis response regulator protein-glutamate methylesterase [Vulcanibacillus sp.]
MKKIRVLVVDDSIFMINLITDILKDSGVIEIIGTASDGKEAVEKAKSLSPDVMTMDIEMPKKNGLDALKEIMQVNPLPIIMLSFLTERGADVTIQALQYGAFDFVTKPSNIKSENIIEIKNDIIDKVLLAYSQREKWITQWNKIGKIVEKKNYYFDNKSDSIEGIVAIGISTGGPKALQEVIPGIPKHFPYSILIVQHMPAGFTNSLANRLDSISQIRVVEAKDGQELEKGTAYLAPGNFHMTVVKNSIKYQIKLDQNEHVGGLRPSVDVLYKSLKDIKLDKIFVVMTGMGSDGTKGLLEAKNEKKDLVIAEDEKSCIVFGMPKSAIQSGLVDEIILLNEISDFIVNNVKKKRGC